MFNRSPWMIEMNAVHHFVTRGLNMTHSLWNFSTRLAPAESGYLGASGPTDRDVQVISAHISKVCLNGWPLKWKVKYQTRRIRNTEVGGQIAKIVPFRWTDSFYTWPASFAQSRSFKSGSSSFKTDSFRDRLLSGALTLSMTLSWQLKITNRLNSNHYFLNIN